MRQNHLPMIIQSCQGQSEELTPIKKNSKYQTAPFHENMGGSDPVPQAGGYH